MNEKSKIFIELDGATFEQTERCRRIIHTLFEQGLFNIKRGEAVLNFDDMGELGSITMKLLKWRRGEKDKHFTKQVEHVIIDSIK